MTKGIAAYKPNWDVLGDGVILCPMGLFVTWWDGEARPRRYRQRLAEPREILRHWAAAVDIEGASLGDLLRLIAALDERDRQVVHDVGAGMFEPYLSELELPPSEPEPTVTVIEVAKDIVIAEDDGRRPHNARVEVSYDVSGRLGTVASPRGRWAIDWTPLNDLVRARLVLRPTGRVIDERSRPEKVVTRFRAEYTLGEVINAVLIEVCFFGSPERRDRTMEDARMALREPGLPMEPFEEWKARADAQAKREEPYRLRNAIRLWRQRHPGEKTPPPPVRRRRNDEEPSSRRPVLGRRTGA